MSDPNWRPGMPLAIGITFVHPVELQPVYVHVLGRGDGSGRFLSNSPSMGQFGSTNTWGLTSGPRRGEGQKTIGRISPLPSIHQVFLEESLLSVKYLNAENTALNSGLAQKISNELSIDIAAAKGTDSFSSLDNAKIEQHIAISLIYKKIGQYQKLTTTAYSILDQNPFYLMRELSAKKLQVALLDKSPTFADTFKTAYLALETAYKAALELKLHDNSIRLLSDRLPGLAILKDTHEEAQRGVTSDWVDAINNKTSLINAELSIRFQILPHFLQDTIINQAGGLDGLPMPTILSRYISITQQIINNHSSASHTFAHANPNIKSPLSKPELEALNNLVNLQTTTLIGIRWADYHRSLLNTEISRHLTDLIKYLQNLKARADIVIQLQREETAKQLAQATEQASRRLADQQAQAEARRKAELLAQAEAQRKAELLAQAEAQREAEQEIIERAKAEETSRIAATKIANTFSAPAAVANSRPLIFGQGPSVGLIERAGDILQVAIQRVIIRLLSNPLAAATLALVSYSPTLGNGELKGVSLPLSYLSDVSMLDGLSVIGSFTALPMRLSIETTENSSTLYATSTTGGHPSPQVRNIPAAWDPQNNRYSATLNDQTGTTLTVVGRPVLKHLPCKSPVGDGLLAIRVSPMFRRQALYSESKSK